MTNNYAITATFVVQAIHEEQAHEKALQLLEMASRFVGATDVCVVDVEELGEDSE